MDLNYIEQKIRALEGGAFQKLCEALFSKEYPNAVIQTNGGCVGSNKTTIGHPDILLKLRDSVSFIFVECTTIDEGIERKLRKDVDACLNYEKTGIKHQNIKEIAFCYTGRLIKNEVYEEVAENLKNKDIDFNAYGISDIALKILNCYPTIASGFLGIDMNVDRSVFEPSDFATQMRDDSLQVKNCDCLFRERDLSGLDECLARSGPVVVLCGELGVGKTAVAVEFARERRKYGESWAVIQANEKPDFVEIAESTHKYGSFLIDNGAHHSESTLRIIKKFEKRKLIITCRNDERDDFVLLLKSNGIDCGVYELAPLPNECIKDIVENATDIKNDIWLEKIAALAKGNVRVAFAAASVCLRDPKGFAALRNQTNVLDSLYGSKIAQIQSSEKESVKLFNIAVAVGILKNLSIEAEQFPLGRIGISKQEFQDLYPALIKHRLISLERNTVVSAMRDSCFLDYLSYYTLLSKKTMPFSTIVNAFFVDQSNKIIELINLFNGEFNSKENQQYISSELRKSWNSFESSSDRDAQTLFCAKLGVLNPTIALRFLRGHIDQRPDTHTLLLNELRDWRLSTISSLLNCQPKMCCQLLKEMIDSDSVDLGTVTKILQERNGVSSRSELRRYDAQKSLLTYFLLQNQEYPLDFLKEYCLGLLKFSFVTFESEGGRMSFFNMLVDSDNGDLNSLRKLCFDVIFRCKDPYKSLLVYFSDFPQPAALAVFRDEVKTIETKLETMHECNEVEELAIYLKAKPIFDHYNLSWEFMEQRLEGSFGFICSLLNRGEEDTADGFNELRERRLERYGQTISGLSFEEKYRLLSLLDGLCACANILRDESFDFAESVFSSLNGNEACVHLEQLSSITNIAAGTDKYCELLSKELIRETGIKDSYLLIINSGLADFKARMIAPFFAVAFKNDPVTAGPIFDLYLSDVTVALPIRFNIHHFIRAKIPCDRIHSFLKAYFEKTDIAISGDYENLFFVAYKESVQLFEYLLENDLKLVERLYLSTIEIGKEYFDYDGKALKRILEIDYMFTVPLFELILNEGYDRFDLDKTKTIWTIGSCFDAADATFDYLRSRSNDIPFLKMTILFGDVYPNRECELSERQFTWIKEYLRKHLDGASVEAINSLVKDYGSATREAYAMLLINGKVASDLLRDFFRQPVSRSWTGSYANVLKKEIDLYEKIKEQIPDDDVFYLDYMQIVDEEIGKTKNIIECVADSI